MSVFDIYVITALLYATFGSWLVKDVLPGLIIAAVASFWIPRSLDEYKLRRDTLVKSVDHLASLIDESAREGVSYWLASSTTREVEERLLFLQGKIDITLRTAAPRLFAKAGDQGVVALADLHDAMTGGSFMVPNRSADPARASDCRRAALALMQLVAEGRKRL